MLRLNFVGVCLIVALCGGLSQAQVVEPAAEHEHLKLDVGTWKATVKMWMGADGQTDPNAEPMVSEGTEVNQMMGPFWMHSEFKGEFAGMPFEGKSVNGYDVNKKQYVGTWFDTFSPHALQMTGTFDKDSRTFTYQTRGIGMDGKPTLGKSVATYPDKDHREVKMYELKDGKELLSMQISYERTK
ncbi:MAG: DUF1579 domain-containing protein [Pirellulaceae bacterium]